MGNDKETTKWTTADEALLIQTLALEKSKGNWGDNNPKPVAFTACEVALAGSECASGGIAKGVPAIKSQWQRVCIIWASILSSNKNVSSSSKSMTLSKSSVACQVLVGMMTTRW